MNFGLTGVAAITVLCYLIGQAVKATGKARKWIPVICGASGGVLGVVGLYCIPSFSVSDPISAAAVGTVSGFAATGVHQVTRQLGKEK